MSSVEGWETYGEGLQFHGSCSPPLCVRVSGILTNPAPPTPNLSVGTLGKTNQAPPSHKTQSSPSFLSFFPFLLSFVASEQKL